MKYIFGTTTLFGSIVIGLMIIVSIIVLTSYISFFINGNVNYIYYGLSFGVLVNILILSVAYLIKKNSMVKADEEK